MAGQPDTDLDAEDIHSALTAAFDSRLRCSQVKMTACKADIKRVCSAYSPRVNTA